MIDNSQRITRHTQNSEQPLRVNSKPSGERRFHQILNESIEPSTELVKADVIQPYNRGIDRLVSERPVIQDAGKGFNDIIKVVFKHEGKTYVKEDAGRESSKFGILKSTAAQFGYTGSMEAMTQRDAEKIYKKIWDKSGAASLPYPLSLVHFDTYVNSPAAARKILDKSEGDIDTYLAMREERYKKLAQARPNRFGRYIKGWMNRIESLRTAVNQHRKETEIASVQPFNDSRIAGFSALSNNEKPLF